MDSWIDGHTASGDAFVASVYGEWGIGKTYCLKAVHDTYQLRLETALKQEPPAVSAIVVPVWFAPWRYEHEEHLVVPLLKTIEHTLRQAESRLASTAPPTPPPETATDSAATAATAASIAATLRRGGETVGRLAQALLSAVKFKASMFGLELDVDPKEAIKLSRELAKEAAAKAAAEPIRPEGQEPLPAKSERTAALAARLESASTLESIYFDAQHQLTSLTAPGIGAVPLRLVVLVDDLDRCLPEKAIQVLESVKLFLNVSGFSFVLAVDDEVVERGIAYRYRDYRLADKDGGFLGDVPISGTQYLEKIVHLPLHLPRWTTEKARAFLLTRYAHLYGAPREGRGEGDRAAAAPNASDALDMVLRAVPLVPRKLIRLSEGVEYLQNQFSDLGASVRWSLLHGIRVVALQQLHPGLYRHLRQRASRYWRLFDLRRDAWGEPQYSGGETLSNLRAAFAGRNLPSPATADPVSAAEQSQLLETQREKLDLLESAHQSGSQRGAGDPLALFAVSGQTPTSTESGLTQQAFSDLYFAAEAPPLPTTIDARVASFRMPPESTIAESQTDAVIAALLSPDAVSRIEAIERHQLAGKRLPEAVMSRLLVRIAADPTDNGPAARVLELPWLRDIAGVVSAQQLLTLYEKAGVIERWARTATREASP